MDHRILARALSSRVNIENCCPSSPRVTVRGDSIRRAGPHGMPNRSRSKPAEYLPGRPLSCINIRYTTFLFDLHASNALIIWSWPLGNNAYFGWWIHAGWIIFKKIEWRIAETNVFSWLSEILFFIKLLWSLTLAEDWCQIDLEVPRTSSSIF